MLRRKNERRRGFTLVELLVVIAIIGILVSLLLPAVQATREAARRISCENNLKQLALALHNYESTYKVFPSGYLHKFGPGGTPEEQANHMGLGWAAAILPQLELGHIYEQLDFKQPIWHPNNLAAREIHIDVFLCPSDTYSPFTWVVRDDSTNPVEQYATSTYAANWGPATEEQNLDDTPLKSRGVFYRNSGTRVSAIFDGLSSTLAFGERTNGPIPLRDPTFVGHIRFENAWSGAVRDVDELADDHGHMVLFETQFRPNELDGDDKGLSAPHGGLCQFALCDGSVRAISQEIDRELYDALATRHGNEVIGEY